MIRRAAQLIHRFRLEVQELDSRFSEFLTDLFEADARSKRS
jgi:hypothetical protein